MENLYDFYFHHNIYTNEWNAFLRSEASLYMSGIEPNPEYSIFRDKDINVLIDKIKSLELSEIL
jgi:hypothetical protein